MESFIRRRNVERFKRLLETTTDEKERERIRNLLQEEEEKQRRAGDKLD